MKYDVVDVLGEVSRNTKGDTKQISLVSWEERQPIYDIRVWNEQQQPTGKGVSFTEQELYSLYRILHEKFSTMPPNLVQIIDKWRMEVPVFYHSLQRLLHFFKEAEYEHDAVVSAYEGKVAILSLETEMKTLQNDFPDEVAKLKRLLLKVHYEKIIGAMMR